MTRRSQPPTCTPSTPPPPRRSATGSPPPARSSRSARAPSRRSARPRSGLPPRPSTPSSAASWSSSPTASPSATADVPDVRCLFRHLTSGTSAEVVGADQVGCQRRREGLGDETHVLLLDFLQLPRERLGAEVELLVIGVYRGFAVHFVA